MPICQKCGTEWIWKQSIKASWKFSGSMRCPHCGANQYATPNSRQRMTFINWLVLLPLLITAIIDIPLLYTIVLTVVLFVIGLSFIPKMMDLSNEQKPLW